MRVAIGVQGGSLRGGPGAGSEAEAAEAARVLVGLDEFEVTGAAERDIRVLGGAGALPATGWLGHPHLLASDPT